MTLFYENKRRKENNEVELRNFYANLKYFFIITKLFIQ